MQQVQEAVRAEAWQELIKEIQEMLMWAAPPPPPPLRQAKEKEVLLL